VPDVAGRFKNPEYVAGYKAGHYAASASRAKRSPGSRFAACVPCQSCGARDARDASHAGGCPALAPASQAELVRLALAVEDGWARKSERARGAGA
jgi:hypothetical protein